MPIVAWSMQLHGMIEARLLSTDARDTADASQHISDSYSKAPCKPATTLLDQLHAAAHKEALGRIKISRTCQLSSPCQHHTQPYAVSPPFVSLQTHEHTLRGLYPDPSVIQWPSGGLAGSLSREESFSRARAAFPVCLAAAVLGTAENWSA